ncbi:MAG: DMT family transporter, partial [Candidatus Eisenbacteria bacterium]|nr:DMT family transporter [Candidatus Eisenbacteria bacterium]
MTLESEWLFLGESAALGTAAMFAVVSILFSLAARETSAFAVNLARITLAVPLLLAFTMLTQSGAWWETLSLNRTLILALSGWIGLTLGDWALFSSFARLGPRVPTLMMTLAPPITAFLAVPLLGETLGWIQIGGMVVTLAGVVWVVLERAPVGTKPHADLALGLSLAFIGATAQGTGLVLSKMGMAGEVDPLPATLVRMVAAMIGAWILVIVQRKWGELGSL